jgi:hypothetical protein
MSDYTLVTGFPSFLAQCLVRRLLETDPGETQDLGESAAHAEVRRMLEGELRRLIDPEAACEAAFADQDFYAGAIRRLSVLRRSELAKKMWAFVEEKSKFFSSETPRADRVRTIRGVIDRFPLLQEADHEATFKNDCI